MPTIGQKLGETRREKGLTVNDVAHATRIHPNMILSIEEDDFSKFPSVAYAKSFIRKYSDHLGVDLSAAMDHLTRATGRPPHEDELIGEVKSTSRKNGLFGRARAPKVVRRRSEKPGGAPLFLNFILFALIAALTVFYFLGYNASTIDQARSDIASGLNLPYTPSEPEPTQAAPPIITKEAGGAPPPEQPATLRSPGAPPSYPVIKPAVSLPLDEPLPESALAHSSGLPENPLRPRETPRLSFVEEAIKPPRIEDLPAVKRPAVDPQAVLRPEGTEPAATKATTPAPPTAAPQNTPESAPGPAPARRLIRAIPVATSE